ncbi:unnamed protein product [Hymenolepis diminuta]|uniref:ANK_REP_REGION domain-containing protein n=1 Tax=Hymenolepis diminuta TaxID=6216 RepID=A0A564Z147_HYMDI|nr:unnamed protein product [Hymenolepis diminuta]
MQDDKVPLMFCQSQPYQTITEYINRLVEAQNLLRLAETRENVEENTKRLGRLPLHYAVQTNLPTVIMLLSKGTDQLQIPDFDDKVPLMFCQSQPYQTITEYINRLVEAQNLLRLAETRENVEENTKRVSSSRMFFYSEV